jgi:3-oxoacid CoA-transferase
LHSLTAISNNAGIEGKGGLAILTKAGQVNRMILSFLGNNKALEKKYLDGDISIELCPQGTLAERLRAGGAGIPAFYTPTGARELMSRIVKFIIIIKRREAQGQRRRSTEH